ncbi:MAG: polyprenyl synthetase family protein [Deltaproteobacteria bacterium]|nr:polyprenyl synthetase family protein [Deltaproteobacteria bacterium]
MHISEAFDVIKDDIRKTEDLFRKNVASDVYLITKMGEYILDSGGKRLRPLVLLLSGRLCGYGGSSHIPLAVVVEFIHTATLLHDDVVDNANLRRGRSSANSVWGNGSSVLAGDYLLAKAFSLAVESKDSRVLKVLAETTTRMAEGEMLQLIKHSDVNTTEGEYLDVITSKTAVLFSASCRMAAILSGAAEGKEKALSDFGLDIGIAYQLVDDCLDYTSKDEELGKRAGNDLREGKVTLPFIKAYSGASGKEKDIMRKAIEAGHATKDQLLEVFEIIKKHRGIEYTTAFAGERIEEAKRHLEVFEPTTDRAALTAVADNVIERTY